MKRLFILLLLLLLPTAALAEGLILSEVCSNNDLLWDMAFSDYVEIYNAGNTAVELSDYALSRDRGELLDCVLPKGTLAPGEYVVLLCDEQQITFNLPKKGFPLFLTRVADKVVCDHVELPAMEDACWTYDAGLVDYPSPGQPNTREGYTAYRATLAQGLVINEVISCNAELAETDDESYDLIELCNMGTKAVELSDYYLSDKKKKLLRSPLPAKTLQPGECATVWASGLQELGHVDFKVSSEGETLYLSHKDGNCVDSMQVPWLQVDTSYGRMGAELAYFEKPTIGKSNGEGKLRQLNAPTASAETGLYAAPIQLTFAGEGELYYTTNGNDPRKKGTLWDGTPLSIEETTIVRACVKAEDAMTSPVQAWHYLYGCEQYELPIISLSSAPNGILGGSGIWAQYKAVGMERETHAVFIENGETRFSLFCGARLHGAGSRKYNKKSLQLRFRGRYGQSTLNEAVFDGIDFDQYDALVLRCGSQDQRRTLFRDEFLTSIAGENMPSVLYQAHKPVNLFIDGQYFGVYYLREKINDTFVAAHLGGSPETVDVVQGWTRAEHGSADDFLALLQTCKTSDMTDPAVFARVAEQVSLESVIDFYIARVYSGDRDFGNIRHVRAQGGKWHIVNFDMDFGLDGDPAGFSTYISSPKETNSLNTVLIYYLLKNPDFRTMMLERLSYHLQNTFSTERALAHLDSMAEEIRHDMAYERPRWGFTLEGWEENVEDMRELVRKRVGQLVESAIASFRMTDEEVQLYFGDLI